MLLHVHWRVCRVVFCFFLNCFSGYEPVIVISRLDSWLILFMGVVRGWTFHQKGIRVFWEGEHSISLTGNNLWWVSDHVTNTTKSHSCNSIGSCTRNSRAFLRLCGLYIRRNLSWIGDGAHHRRRQLNGRIRERVCLDLAIILSSRLDLDATINKLFVTTLDLCPFEVFFEHLNLFLKKEILSLNLSQLLLFLFERLNIELKIFDVIFEVLDLCL